MRRMGRKDNRGVLLISSYLLLAIFLVYSNVLTMRAITQRLGTDRLRLQSQARDLAQASIENYKEQLYQFFSSTVYQQHNQGNAVGAMRWLDALKTDSENPGFSNQLCVETLPPLTGTAVSSGRTKQVTQQVCKTVTDGKTTSTVCAPQTVTVAEPVACDMDALNAEGTAILPRATVVDVQNLGEDANGNGLLDANEDINHDGILQTNGNDLSPRLVVLEGQATVGGVTKLVRASYVFKFNTSNIFRYAYFVNNFGWFTPSVNTWTVNGDIRANGDLWFGSNADRKLYLHGDAYASKNPNAINPLTGKPSNGLIMQQDPSDKKLANYYDKRSDYWKYKDEQARPDRDLSLASNTPIGGSEYVLADGLGWTQALDDGSLAPKKYPGQKTQDMPYLGDLDIYRQQAQQKQSTLKSPVTGVNVSQQYTGPAKALVLVGTAANPIVINGPVVIPGDVIIKGVVTGRGTIYAGRNIHIVGELIYKKPFEIPTVRWNPDTGVLIERETGMKLGKLCDDGTYVAPNPNGSIPSGGC